MAPLVPSVDMSLVQSAEILKLYWMLYQEMKKDFVHKEDFKMALSTNLVEVAVELAVGTGTAQFPMLSSDAAAQAKGQVYEGLLRTGDAVKMAATSAIKGILS